MKKTKTFKITLGTIMLAVAFLFAVAAVLMMFTTAVRGEGNILGSTATYTGAQVAFGVKDGDTVELGFNVMSFLGLFILPLGAIVLMCLGFIAKNKLFTYLSAGILLVSAILAFLTATTFSIGAQDAHKLWTWSLGIGAILAGVFEILSCSIIVAKDLLKQ